MEVTKRTRWIAVIIAFCMMLTPCGIYAETEMDENTQPDQLAEENTELKEQLSELQAQVEALIKENEELKSQLNNRNEENETGKNDLSEEDLKNAADAYWSLKSSAKNPDTMRIKWASVYQGKDILLCGLGMESDGRYYPEYVYLYDIEEQSETSLCKEMDLEDKYTVDSGNAVAIDWNDVIEFSASDEYDGEAISEDSIITDEEAKRLIEESKPTPTSAPAPVEYTDRITVRLAQEALNAAGYNCGTPDGIAGTNTEKAISDYQTANGLTVTGTVTDELLSSLGIVEKVQKAVEAEQMKDKYDSSYTYDQLARNPDTYTGNLAKVSGKVLQADSAGSDTYYMRLAMNSDYDTVIFVTYPKGIIDYRLLEGDIVSVYGTCMGVYSYEAVSGATLTIPWIHADNIEMQ